MISEKKILWAAVFDVYLAAGWRVSVVGSPVSMTEI